MIKQTNPPLVVHVIYRLSVGGLENGLINLINQMPNEKYRHAIICLTQSTQFSERLKDKNVRIIELHKKQGQDWGSFVNFYRLLKQLKADIIHTRNLAAIEYQIPAFIAGVKHRIHSEHGWDVFDPDGNNKKYQWLRRLLHPFIKVFIPLSLHLQDYLVEKVKIPENKIHRICNGVDTQIFYPDKKRQQPVADWPISFDEEKVCIGTVGRMHGVKDQMTLVKAFIILVQTHSELKGRVNLILIGDGALRAEIIETLEKHQLLQTAWLPGARQDIAEIMRKLDVFVLPSQAEGISNTILEAMATALPVIATEVGGNPELVKEGETGLLVPPSNPELMANALLELITNKDKRLELGKNAYQSVIDNFSIQVMVNNYTAVYDSVIAKGKY